MNKINKEGVKWHPLFIGRNKVENVREKVKTFGGLGKLQFCHSVKVGI